MTAPTYTPAKAERLILSGKGTGPMNVTGSLDLSGTQITALPDNLTVTGSLYLRSTQITALPDNLTVTGSLDLSGTQITALPDNLTVTGSLYLRGCDLSGVTLPATITGSLDLSGAKNPNPSQWWTENGEVTRRRCLAICPDNGYALTQTDTDRFSAGCRKNLTRAQALKHWSRTDARAVLFAAAINAHSLEPVA